MQMNSFVATSRIAATSHLIIFQAGLAFSLLLQQHCKPHGGFEAPQPYLFSRQKKLAFILFSPSNAGLKKNRAITDSLPLLANKTQCYLWSHAESTDFTDILYYNVHRLRIAAIYFTVGLQFSLQVFFYYCNKGNGVARSCLYLTSLGMLCMFFLYYHQALTDLKYLRLSYFTSTDLD